MGVIVGAGAPRGIARWSHAGLRGGPWPRAQRRCQQAAAWVRLFPRLARRDRLEPAVPGQ